LLKFFALPIVAANAVAVIGPIPGTFSRRWLISLSLRIPVMVTGDSGAS
jgi:hypothetical protein